jgi:hypothetical protein
MLRFSQKHDFFLLLDLRGSQLWKNKRRYTNNSLKPSYLCVLCTPVATSRQSRPTHLLVFAVQSNKINLHIWYAPLDLIFREMAFEVLIKV